MRSKQQRIQKENKNYPTGPGSMSVKRVFVKSWRSTDAPTKFITIVTPLHDGMKARVQDGGESSEPFSVSNGVKGCVFAPTVFSLMFSAMLTGAFKRTEIRIGIRLHFVGSVLNLRRLQAKTKVQSDTINDLLFSDDCAVNATSEANMQHSVERFSDACDNLGLTISTKKTEVMPQPAPGKPYVEPNINVKNHRLNAVVHIPRKYSFQELVINDEVNARLAKASVAFRRLCKNVRNRRCITTETKVKLYRAEILTTLLYVCEAWTVYQRHARKLNNFHTTSLRKLLSIKWQEKIPDTEVLTPAGLFSVHEITATLGRTHSTYARPPTPQETIIWRATRRRALPRRSKEAFQLQFKDLPQEIYHRP